MNRGVPCKYVVRKEDCPYGKKCRFLHQYRTDLNTEGYQERGQAHGGNHHARQRQPPRETRVCMNDGGSSERQGSEVIQVSDGAMRKTDENLKGGVEGENGGVKNMADGKGGTRGVSHEAKAARRTCRFYLMNSHCKYGDRCRYSHFPQDRTIKEENESLNEISDREVQTQKPERKPNESVHQSTPQPSSHMYESSRQRSSQPTIPGEGPRQSDSQNPPPLTLASFIGGRAHVQRSHKSSRSQKGSSTDTLREVEVEQLQARFPGESCTLLVKSHNKVTYRIWFEPTDPEWRGPKTIQMDVTLPGNYPKEHCHVELSAAQELSADAIACANEEILGYWQADMLGGLMFRPFLHWWDKNLVGILQSYILSSDDDENDDDDDPEEEEVEQTRISTKSKKGTEIRFVGLDMSQTLGTAFWTAIKVVLSCSRCKNHQEIELKEDRLYSVMCGRCSNSMRVIYHLALIHISSATLGYLELTSCTPVDVLFQSSTLSLTCLNCNSEVASQGFFVGQPKDVYCRRCHNKITISASGIKFLQHVQSDISGPQSGPVTVIQSSRKQADTLLKDGQPLPDYGICQHYKKSHRWLRFPCCGRAFPCDVCHDTVQDHPMERANRMICGFCSKEQGYTGKGECVRCRTDLISAKHSAHWEGGQGCRNKVKMNRLDRQKYTNNEKTTCKKSERVGKSQKTHVHDLN